MVLLTGLLKKSAAKEGRLKAHILRLVALGSLLLLSPFSLSDLNATEIDIELKQRLVSALAASDGEKDRFDTSVWITDMEARLKPYIDDSAARLTLLEYVYQESRRVDIPPELVLAVIHIESRFDQFAISRAGARGLMQIMPFWLDEIGRPEDNLFTIETNLRFGCTILRHYVDKENGDITKALARYNGSHGQRQYPDKVFDKLRLHWYRS